jgi:hypothetical protein
MSSAQLEAHLREQLELLDHYCDAHDEGKIVSSTRNRMSCCRAR